MPDYKDLGLDQNMRALSSLSNSAYLTERDFKQYIDDRVRNVRRPGGLDFQAVKNTSLGYQAVVGKDNTGGAFTDIQDAVNYLSNLGGGRMFIRAGTYYPSDIIKLSSNISIVGEDNTKTRINFGTSEKYLSAIGTTDARLKNIHISDISLTNYGDGTGEGVRSAIAFKYVDNFSVTNCIFGTNNSGITELGDIQIYYSTRGIIKNNYSAYSFKFVEAGYVSNLDISNNFIEEMNEAIRIGLGTTITVMGNLIKNAYYSIHTYAAGGNANIIGNVVINDDNNGYGILIDAGSINIITNNIIIKSGTYTAGNGIHVGVNNNTIGFNSIIGGTWATGISITGDNNTIIGNNIPVAGTGIFVGTTASRTILSSNLVYGPATAISDNGTLTTSVGNITA